MKRSLTMSSKKNVDDRLSRLPEEIVSRILSLMPTKFAVRTSILSKRWRYTWMLVTNLDFDDIHPFHDDKILSKFVDQVLDLRVSSPIQLFRLHFIKSLIQRSSVSNWIDKAVRLDVRELDIDVIQFELPLTMFTCKTLTKLRLNCSIYDDSDWQCPPSVYLPCLKTLDIVVYKDPFVNAFKLINGCPTLESLSLEVTLHDEKDDYVFNIPTLKRMKLTYPTYAHAINKVVLRVPKLEYLFVGGTLCSPFVMEDVSSLVEACVSFSQINSDHLWVALLKGLSGVKSLSVQNIPSELPLPIFPNMKHLELKSFRNSGLVLQFLESCPELKHLCIEEKQAFAWVESKLVPACMLTNLATFKFSICERWRYDIPFLKYMLQNGEVLKTVTITWKYSSHIEQETRLCEKVFELPRASRCCEIRFHGNWSRFTSS